MKQTSMLHSIKLILLMPLLCYKLFSAATFVVSIDKMKYNPNTSYIEIKHLNVHDN